MKTEYVSDELHNFLDAEGRLVAYPAKRRLKILALFYLAAKLEVGRKYSEKEINELLCRWHNFEDWSMLRRELFNKRFLGRERSGASYWLEAVQPAPADFGMEELL